MPNRMGRVKKKSDFSVPVHIDKRDSNELRCARWEPLVSDSGAVGLHMTGMFDRPRSSWQRSMPCAAGDGRTDHSGQGGLVAHKEADKRRIWVGWAAICLFVGSFAIYNLNFREVSEDDTRAVRLLPLSMILERDFDLDEFEFLHQHQEHPAYYLKRVGNHYYSRSPFMPAVMAVPIYWVAMKIGFIRIGESDLYYTATFTSKVAASMMAAASVAFMFLALMKVASRRRAIVLALVYAFGTNTWAVSSQGLWQHAPSQFWLALVWLFVLPRNGVRPINAWSCVFAGLAAGMAYSVRPATVPISLVCLAYCVHRGRAQSLWFAVAFVAAALPSVAHNLAVFGTIQGGYADLTHFHPALGRVQNPWGGRFWDGLPGLLFSPSRGLLIYTPVCIFSLLGAYYWQRRGNVVGWYLLASVLVVLLIGSKFFSWWAGWSFGPRYLMDTIPALVLLMAGVDRLLQDKRLAIPFILVSVYSVGVQAVGAWCYPAGWNWAPVNVDKWPQRLWDWRDTQLRRCLTHGMQPTFWHEWSNHHSKLALQKFAARQYEDVARSARRAIELNPANHIAHNILGNIYAVKGQLQHAEPHYRDALRANPAHAQAHSNLAVCLIARGALDDAELHVREAIAIAPELAVAYRNLGDICARTGRPEHAVRAYREALRLNPDDEHSARSVQLLGNGDRKGHNVAP